MKKPLRQILTTLTLATAAATGALIATDSVATPQGDTAWGSPATPSDTAWGTPTASSSDGTTLAPQDTAWG